VFPFVARVAGSGLATAASLCIADMRAQRTARLCAAAVGGGRRLMRLPMALVWVDSGPKRRIDRVGAQ
jgi:hypothetical protein